MAIPIFSTILNLVSGGFTEIMSTKREQLKTKLAERGIDLEEKQIDAMLEVSKIEFEKYIRANAVQIDSDFRNFVVQYEGAAKDVHTSVQILRAVIRPFITLWAVFLISYLMFSDPGTILKVTAAVEQIPEKLWDIFFIIFAFWFGGRAVQQFIDKYTNGKTVDKRAEAEGKVDEAREATKQKEIEANSQPSNNFQKDFSEDQKNRAFPRRVGPPGRRR